MSEFYNRLQEAPPVICVNGKGREVKQWFHDFESAVAESKSGKRFFALSQFSSDSHTFIRSLEIANVTNTKDDPCLSFVCTDEVGIPCCMSREIIPLRTIRWIAMLEGATEPISAIGPFVDGAKYVYEMHDGRNIHGMYKHREDELNVITVHMEGDEIQLPRTDIKQIFKP